VRVLSEESSNTDREVTPIPPARTLG
jgi:hypothetical protein